MLTITIPAVSAFDDEKQQFVELEGKTVVLEHSLVSLSKWEAKWEKPFLSQDKKTTEETLSYIQCMVLDDELSMDDCYRVSSEDTEAISAYINAKHSATFFSDENVKKPGRREIITAEIIYFWMTSLQIPIEHERWHLSRLITLIKVINEKNAAANDTKKKAPSRADLEERRRIVEQRRAQAAAN